MNEMLLSLAIIVVLSVSVVNEMRIDKLEGQVSEMSGECE